MRTTGGEDAGTAPMAAVGARVRELRRAAGLSLKALAAAARIGQGTLSELENGARNATLETLYRLAGPLGVPLAALLDERPGATASDGALDVTLLRVERTADGATREIHLMRLRAGESRTSPAHGPGVHETLLVLRGTLEAGPPDGLRRAAAGESLAFPSDGAHSYRAEAPEGASAGDTAPGDTASGDAAPGDVEALVVITTPGRPSAPRSPRGASGAGR